MPKTSKRTPKLPTSRGLLRSRELVQSGISRVRISRLVAGGQLQRVARGLRSCTATGLDDLKSNRPKASAVGPRQRETYGHFCCIVKCEAPSWATDGPHLGHRWATTQKSRANGGSLRCNYLICLVAGEGFEPSTGL
jgi:hypothetical protein